MMKTIYIIILFLSVLSQHCFADDDINTTNTYEINNANLAHKYICYKFGSSNVVTINIEECDTMCKVFISDKTGILRSTTCLKEPILKWAFDKMSKELIDAKYTENDESDIFFYQLSIFESNKKIASISSSKIITDNPELISKLDRLKAVIVKLWLSTFKQYNIKLLSRSQLNVGLGAPAGIVPINATMLTNNTFILYNLNDL